METITLNIQLETQQMKLLNSLAKYTGYPVEEMLKDITVGKTSWKELKKINEFHEYSQNPHSRWYTAAEVKESLRTGIIPE